MHVQPPALTHAVGAIEGATFDNEQGGYKFPADATIPEISFAVGETLYKVRLSSLLP